jgi:RimJ/RimL family protein N-acetyltransferase
LFTLNPALKRRIIKCPCGTCRFGAVPVKIWFAPKLPLARRVGSSIQQVGLYIFTVAPDVFAPYFVGQKWQMERLRENIRIVPMAEAHIESFRVCLDAVARERRYLALTEAPTADAVREFVRSALGRQVPQFVALEGKQVIGWCDIFPHERESFAHVGRLGMGVLPLYRGQGTGRRLAEKTIAQAKRIGLERIELDVYASNKPAIALYQSLGFAVEGVKRKGRKLDGIYDDVVVMGSLL